MQPLACADSMVAPVTRVVITTAEIRMVRMCCPSGPGRADPVKLSPPTLAQYRFFTNEVTQGTALI
jgi:hypothetical protein